MSTPDPRMPMMDLDKSMPLVSKIPAHLVICFQGPIIETFVGIKVHARELWCRAQITFLHNPFLSTLNLHHHFESIAKLASCNDPKPKPPYSIGPIVFSHAVQFSFAFSSDPPQKNTLLNLSNCFKT
ncbi:hypothetical protein HanHA300_Chr17g0637461 [Helianthus annuus]|nr:hypothetical protein HanHA300_Chr17g0637461 [Helianthus annuus]KAJ0445928.1 hypothetical protein HanHA89_Chr17g0688751 [Helianthus annuus]KAJ0630892.1 hypothetical protein HanLR1_Chr17g0648121 [Helianthus annuus]